MTISYKLEDLAYQIIVVHYFCLHFVSESPAMPRFGAHREQMIEGSMAVGWIFQLAILISVHGTYVQRETRVFLFLCACVRCTRTILLLNTMTWSSPTESRKKKIFMFTNNIKVALH